MLRIFLGGLIGAAILFVWGMISWMALPWHNATMAEVPDTQQTVTPLRQVITQPGFYYYPPMPPDNSPEAREAHRRQHLEGPFLFMIYHPSPGEPMPPTMFAFGFVLNLAAALMAGIMLRLTHGTVKNYAGRVGVVTLLGLFVAVVADAALWNWMHYPADYSLVMMGDHVVGWLLVGLAMGAVVRPSASAGGKP